MATQTNWLDMLMNPAPNPVNVPNVEYTTSPKPKITRHYYRCCDCLSPMVTDTKLPVTLERGYIERIANCSCGGQVEYIGPVKGDTWTRYEDRPACDGRCTGAVGPNCDCRCGGENHGSNLWVSVQVESGKLPTLITRPAEALRGEEYRKLYAQVRAAYERRYGRVNAMKAAREWMDAGDFSHYLDGQHLWKQVQKARGLRTFKGRQNKLNGILKDLTDLTNSGRL